MNRKDDSGGPDENMDGFLHIAWHGAHDGGEGKDREIGAMVEIARDVGGGNSACISAQRNVLDHI
jgi:hypothetical protein